MAEPCSHAMWEAKLASEEIGYLVEDISKQSIEGKIWFLFIAYRKIMRGKGYVEGILGQKEPELNLGIS